MSTIRERSEKLMNGEVSIREEHPLRPGGQCEEIAASVAFFNWFANFCAVKTAEGLVLIDTGMATSAAEPAAMLRGYSTERIGSVIYTQGGAEHVGAMAALAAEAARNRAARPRIVAHRATLERLDRHRRTAGYYRAVYRRHFDHLGVQWPEEFVNPDTCFDHQFTLSAGNHRFECHHARGPAEDTCWIYLPQAKVLFAGAFITWSIPVAGNPAGALCYAREWAEALRAMAKSGAEVMVPGHGLPIFGMIRIRQVLNETAECLQTIYDQTLALLNEGAPLERAIDQVRPPAELSERPFLRAILDEPEYIVRNIYRLEGGWYDGVASHLKPALLASQGRELIELAGGASRVVARAMSRFNAGDLKLAAHLIDLACAAVPDDPAVNQARMQIYGTCAEQSPALITRAIFREAERESAARIGLGSAERKD